MQVLFIKDLRGKGKKGEVKEVKAGYGQNFLIRNGYAVALTEQNFTKYQKEQEALEQNDLRLRSVAEEVKKKIEKEEMVFLVQVGKEDRVFGKISPKQIKDKLEEKGYVVDKKQIHLSKELSTLGYHEVEILLHKGVVAKLKIKLEK